MARGLRDSSDDEFKFDEYFTRTYQPLSNLPTPPPSSRSSSGLQSPKIFLEDGELVTSSLLGPAIHLVNLVPAAASLTTPSVPLVHEMLTLANLSLNTLALAVCVLDTLNSRFALSWRLVCPLPRHDFTPGHVKRHSLASPGLGSKLYVDCVKPEVIVLASLIIAVKFVEDWQEPTRYYCSAWGKEIWTCDQINATEQCIMESLGYRILPLWNPELIGDALRDMERAGRQAVHLLRDSHGHGEEQRKRSASSIRVFRDLGFQFTPVEISVPTQAPSKGAVDGRLATAFPRKPGQFSSKARYVATDVQFRNCLPVDGNAEASAA